MSQENVAIVRSVYELGVVDPGGISRGRVERLFRDFLDEQCEAHLPPDYPEGEPVFRGREGLAQLNAMLRDAWGVWRIAPERFLDAGDHVVVFAQIHGEGGASGVPVDFETTHVWTVRNGRATAMHAYRDRAAALEAAGLSG